MSLQAEILTAVSKARVFVPEYPALAKRLHDVYTSAGFLDSPEFTDPLDEALRDLGSLMAAVRVACRELQAHKRAAMSPNSNSVPS